VRIQIYDVLGREVRELVNERKETGIFNVVWNAKDNDSNIYFVSIIVIGNTGEVLYKDSRKILVLK
jgi:flagellar hook assembly protein FlgD